MQYALFRLSASSSVHKINQQNMIGTKEGTMERTMGIFMSIYQCKQGYLLYQHKDSKGMCGSEFP